MAYGWETNRTDSLSGFIFNSCQCVSLNEDDYGFQGSQVACSNSKATGFVWLFSTVCFQISVWLNEDDNLNDLEKGFQGSQVARSNSKVTAKGRRRSISYPNLLQIYLFILTCHRYFIQASNMLACKLDWNIHTFLFTFCQNLISFPFLTQFSLL